MWVILMLSQSGDVGRDVARDAGQAVVAVGRQQRRVVEVGIAVGQRVGQLGNRRVAGAHGERRGQRGCGRSVRHQDEAEPADVGRIDAQVVDIPGDRRQVDAEILGVGVERRRAELASRRAGRRRGLEGAFSQ